MAEAQTQGAIVRENGSKSWRGGRWQTADLYEDAKGRLRVRTDTGVGAGRIESVEDLLLCLRDPQEWVRSLSQRLVESRG